MRGLQSADPPTPTSCAVSQSNKQIAKCESALPIEGGNGTDFKNQGAFRSSV